MIRASLLAFLLSAAGFAQSIPTCAAISDIVAEIKKAPANSDERLAAIRQAIVPAKHAACIATQLAERGLARQIEAVRTDKQSGAGASGGSGTTSLISKGVVAKALSIASDYGALTQSVSGQTVTVKGSLDGIPSALVRGGIAPYCLDGIPPELQKGCISQKSLNLLQRLSYSVSFDTSRNSQAITGTPAAPPASTGSGGTTPVTFTPTGHQISSISGRVEIWNQRDKTSADYATKWLTAVKDTTDKGKELAKTADALLKNFQAMFDLSFVKSSAYQAWFSKAAEKLNKSADVDKDWSDVYRELLDLLKAQPDMTQHATDFVLALNRYQLAQDDLIAAAAKKAVVTFEYTDNRPVGQDADSTFRVIFDKGFGKHWSITANGAINVWDRDQSTPTMPIGRLRDAQAGAEIDYKLDKLGTLLKGAATLSGAYYFQYQKSAILLNVDPTQPLPGITFNGLPSGAAKVLAQTGDIHIGQVKLLLGPGTSSVRVPIAFSYSNRTELVPKPNWRAQIGISYDFDSLFTK